MPFFPPFLSGILGSIKIIWQSTWWIILPFLAAFLFWNGWVYYRRFLFIRAIEWQLLELKVPKNILKTPKSMEQVFAAAHAPYSYGLRFMEKYWEGKVEYWMSFELVSLGGEVHFYLRLPKQYRHSMEAAIYAQYPESEITVARDYLQDLPRVLPNKTYTLYGQELILRAPSPYPLRTYEAFEEVTEERRVDPIAGITEAMSKLKADEQLLIQILIRPTGDDWRMEGEAIIDEIMGRKKPSPPGFFESIYEFIRNLFTAPFEHPIWSEEKAEDTRSPFLILDPVKQEITKAIKTKISKIGFESTIRFIYIDRRDSFSRDHVAATVGFFRQFNSQTLNLLKPDKHTMTAAVHGLFKKLRLEWRRRIIYDKYRYLELNKHKPILNIEELATLYHFPIFGVEAPSFQRIEAKKGEPPPTLPIQ